MFLNVNVLPSPNRSTVLSKRMIRELGPFPRDVQVTTTNCLVAKHVRVPHNEWHISFLSVIRLVRFSPRNLRINHLQIPPTDHALSLMQSNERPSRRGPFYTDSPPPAHASSPVIRCGRDTISVLAHSAVRRPTTTRRLRHRMCHRCGECITAALSQKGDLILFIM